MATPDADRLLTRSPWMSPVPFLRQGESQVSAQQKQNPRGLASTRDYVQPQYWEYEDIFSCKFFNIYSDATFLRLKR